MKKLLLIPMLSGCMATVPATKFTINPTNGMVTIDSPKDITISNLTATLPNGTHFELHGYQSHNSPEVLATVAQANAAMADKNLQMLDKVIAITSSVAAKTATGGVAP